MKWTTRKPRRQGLYLQRWYADGPIFLRRVGRLRKGCPLKMSLTTSGTVDSLRLGTIPLSGEFYGPIPTQNGESDA